MIYGVTWADAAIFVILVLSAYKGLRLGFIGELAGLVAIVAGLAAPWLYNGILDEPIAQATKLALPVAHVAGMIGTGIAAYVIVLVVASLLKGIAKLPLLGLGNAIAGAATGSNAPSTFTLSTAALRFSMSRSSSLCPVYLISPLQMNRLPSRDASPVALSASA